MRIVLTELRKAVLEDGATLVVLALVWATLVVLLAFNGVNGLGVGSYATNLLLYLFNLCLMILAVLGWRLYRARPASPIRFLLAFLRSPQWLAKAARGLPMLAALIVFMPIFSAMKSAIPLFNAFSWDATWIAADQAIHGTDPWRLLQPVLGFPIITSLLSFAYHAWLFLIYAGSMYFCFFAADRELRARYFIAFFMIWTIIGVAMATGFASVGPCFVDPLLNDDRFSEQMAYLRAADEHYRVLVLPVQEMLLDAHMKADSGLGSGISAMPSMHVSMALLFALSIRSVSKIAGVAAFAFLVIIAVGSVHLAYHYAVDGYVSMISTAIIWAVSKPLAQLMQRRGSAPSGYATAAQAT